jgi:phytoene dehydrogenase-like protein
MSKSVIIIGGGLTGLSAGCYLRMNGYTTSVFEMHNITGGVCTGWKRKDYTFDGAMNWLVGTNPASSFYQIWEELGVSKGWTVYDHDRFIIMEGTGGKTLNFYSDVGRLEQHMMELAPEDAEVIREFTGAIRSMEKMDMPVDKAPELYGFWDMFKMFRVLPYMGLLKKWGKVSTLEFSRRFKNPLLREAFIASMAGESEGTQFPLLFMLFTFAWLDQKMAGYLVGGGLEMAHRIEKRYLELGGELHLSSRVSRILVENGKTTGIRMEDGKEFRADIIISAADGHATLFDMLEGKYMDAKTRALYENPRLFPPLVYVSLGINRTFSEIPASVAGLIFPVSEPVVVAGKEHRWMNVLNYSFDPTLAPNGKTVLRTQFNTDFDYWKKLRDEPERYKAEKEKIADQVIGMLDKRYPGLAGKVEARDVATPVTWERYTGNWRGSYEGWLLPGTDFNLRMSKTMPGLENFYMAGQWVEPGGGMPTAAMSGRNVTQIICSKDRKKFVTTKV